MGALGVACRNAVAFRPRPVPGAVGVRSVCVACSYSDVVVSVVLEAGQRMRSSVWVGVAGCGRVGWIILSHPLGLPSTLLSRWFIWSFPRWNVAWWP